MDIKQEITNHLEWMETIALLLGDEEVTEEDLKAIAKHDSCKLGRWLNSEASSKYKGAPELQKLVKSHELFHELAAQLLNSFQHEEEVKVIEAQARFIETSQNVISHLQALQGINR